jgi:hypothetical protein
MNRNSSIKFIFGGELVGGGGEMQVSLTSGMVKWGGLGHGLGSRAHIRCKLICEWHCERHYNVSDILTCCTCLVSSCLNVLWLSSYKGSYLFAEIQVAMYGWFELGQLNVWWQNFIALPVHGEWHACALISSLKCRIIHKSADTKHPYYLEKQAFFNFIKHVEKFLKYIWRAPYIHEYPSKNQEGFQPYLLRLPMILCLYVGINRHKIHPLSSSHDLCVQVQGNTQLVLSTG